MNGDLQSGSARWGAGIVFLLGCLILAIGFGNFATGQIESPAPAAGRYQFSLKAINSSNTVLFVFDSTTGRCWYRDSIPTTAGGAGWTDLGTPLEKK